MTTRRTGARTGPRLVKLGIGLAIVVAIVLAVGTGPFLRGLAAVSPGAITAALLLTALGTTAAAVRWRAVAAGLGLHLRWSDALAAYYRSQFLNSVLPGGVLGDVHRAYRHGRHERDLTLAARAVATERVAGQIVQWAVMATLLASLGLTTSLRGVGWAVAVVAGVVGLTVLVAVALPGGRRVLNRELGAVRRVFSDARRSAVIVGSSVVAVASLCGIFVVASIAVGVTAPLRDLVALALVALTAAALPFNVGGWGPREAAAASAFAIAGLGSAAGVAAATTFGVLTLIAVAPGAVVLLADRFVGATPSLLPTARPILLASHPTGREETIA